MRLPRRDFLALSTSAMAAALIPAGLAEPTSPQKPGALRFVFFTDTHLEPELKGDEGSAMAMRKIRTLKPEFCIQGGDHCFDVNAVPRERSLMLLDLYAKTSQQLDGVPVHHALGNHDVFGRDPKANVAASDPLYGKKMFEQRFESKTFYSFDRKGYHFVVLDSIGLAPNGLYDGRIDETQLRWLAADLGALAAGTPVIVTTHIPLVSSVMQYGAGLQQGGKPYNSMTVGNAYDAIALFEGHNVIAVLQGHTHINETVWWRDVPYITSGAVCGNWWKGPRWGTPEGFTVVELDGGRAHWRYETYGWKSVEAETDARRVILQPVH